MKVFTQSGSVVRSLQSLIEVKSSVQVRNLPSKFNGGTLVPSRPSSDIWVSVGNTEPCVVHELFLNDPFTVIRLTV